MIKIDADVWASVSHTPVSPFSFFFVNKHKESTQLEMDFPISFFSQLDIKGKNKGQGSGRGSERKPRRQR